MASGGMCNARLSNQNFQQSVVDSQPVNGAIPPTSSAQANTNISREHQALAVWNSIPNDLKAYILTMNGAPVHSTPLVPQAPPPRPNFTGAYPRPNNPRHGYGHPGKTFGAPGMPPPRFSRPPYENQQERMAQRPGAQSQLKEINRVPSDELPLTASVNNKDQKASGTIILPNFDVKETFADEPTESWEGFIERWEIGMMTFGLDELQLAQCLPKSLKGSAYQTYIGLVKAGSPAIRDYAKLKSELSSAFLRHKPMKGRSLFTLSQGKKSVGTFYDEVVTAGKSAYADMPADYKNRIIRDAFINGLKDKYQDKILASGDVSLEKALDIAKRVEYTDTIGKGQKLVAASQGHVNCVQDNPDQLQALTQQMSALTELVRAQTARPPKSHESSKHSFPSNGSGKGSNSKWVPKAQNQQKFQHKNTTSANNPRETRNFANSQPKSRLFCTHCRIPGHDIAKCYKVKRGVNAVDLDTNHEVTAEMSDDQFAEMLCQPAEEKEHVNVVMDEKPKRRRNRKGKGSGITPTTYASLALMTLLCQFVGGEAVHPRGPLICGSRKEDSPHIFRVNTNYHCDSRVQNATLKPAPLRMMVYQRNLVKWNSLAYQCSKFRQTITTEVSFFTDIKTKTTSSEPLSITKEECLTMVSNHECKDGTLYGGQGVYLTKNPIDAEYKYCCKKHDFSADQCSTIETTVYKRHGAQYFESPAGDVSHCNYDHGSCLLADGTMLVWEKNENVTCEFEPDFSVNGTYFDGHFVSDDFDLAFTFTKHGLHHHKDCQGRVASMTDQGLLVRFLTPLPNITLDDHVVNEYTAWGDDTALLNAMIQDVATDLATSERKQFWDNYAYTCQNIAATLKIVSLLMSQHPTISARYMLKNPNITARAGPSFVQVYPCTQLSAGMYNFVAMPKDNCTEYLPMNVTIGGKTHTGFLDPVMNVVHSKSMQVKCELQEEALVQLNDTIYKYKLDGTLEVAKVTHNLTLPNIHLGAHPVEIHESIFSLAHRLNWQEFSDHSALNDMLATFSRQHQVLHAMGVATSPHKSFEENVVESKEEVLGRSFMAFLFGGHVASGFELWTLAVNVIVSVISIALLGYGCLLKCCIPRFGPSRESVNAIRAQNNDEEELEVIVDQTPAFQDANDLVLATNEQETMLLPCSATTSWELPSAPTESEVYAQEPLTMIPEVTFPTYFTEEF